MKFVLTYEGPLPSAAKSTRIPEKHHIRKQIHSQLLELYNTHSAISKWLEQYTQAKGEIELPEDQKKSVLRVFPIDKFDFIPLVSKHLRLTCHLDILFLRHEEAGRICTGGDIDNRILTLFDGLKMPERKTDLPSGAQPDSYEIPFLCLLEDDSLVTRLNVETERWLYPLPKDRESDVRLIIDVTIKVIQWSYGNFTLISD